MKKQSKRNPRKQQLIHGICTPVSDEVPVRGRMWHWAALKCYLSGCYTVGRGVRSIAVKV